MSASQGGDAIVGGTEDYGLSLTAGDAASVPSALGPRFEAEDVANRRDLSAKVDQLGSAVARRLEAGHAAFMDSSVTDEALILAGKLTLSSWEAIKGVAELAWAGGTLAAKAAAAQTMFIASATKSLVTGDWDALQAQAQSAAENVGQIRDVLGARGEQLVDGLGILADLSTDGQVMGALRGAMGTITRALANNPSQMALGAFGFVGDMIGGLGVGKAGSLGLGVARGIGGAGYIDGDNPELVEARGRVGRLANITTETVEDLMPGLQTALLRQHTLNSYRSVAEAAGRNGLNHRLRDYLADPALARMADIEKPGAVYGMMRAESLGWKRVGTGLHYDGGNHGIDFLYQHGDRLIVLETKSGRGLWALERDKSGLVQGTSSWIDDRARKVLQSNSDSAANKAAATDLRSALERGRVDSYASLARSDKLFKLDLQPSGRYYRADAQPVDWPPRGI